MKENWVLTNPDKIASEVCETAMELNPEEIKRIRESMGLSQFAFAMKFGIPLATIRSWERGTREPRAAAKAFLRTLKEGSKQSAVR